MQLYSAANNEHHTFFSLTMQMKHE